MTREERLSALQFAMLRGETPSMPSATPSARPTSTVARPTSAATMIAQLRQALAVERQARLAAEARLREVLEEVGRQAVTPPATMVETPMLPPAAAEPEVFEGEVMSVGDAISALGGDDYDEEDYDG